MPVKWKCPTRTILVDWIDKSLLSHTITDWERSFLLSFRHQLKSKDELSQKQVEILERIYSEKTK